MTGVNTEHNSEQNMCKRHNIDQHIEITSIVELPRKYILYITSLLYDKSLEIPRIL